MKLHYRGNSYEYNPQSIEIVESEITAKYRGANYKIKQPVNLAVPDSILNFKFRGVAYIKGKKYGNWLSRKSMGSSTNDTQPTCQQASDQSLGIAGDNSDEDSVEEFIV